MHDVRFGPFHLQPDLRRLTRDGLPIDLGSRAMDVLLALVAARPAPVSKDDLMRTVWPNRVVEENNLQVQVSTLRRLLGAASIATLPGRGYQFVAPVTAVPADAPPGEPPRTDAVPPIGNLPERPPVLYGRDADVAAVARMVGSQPLTTVVGSGGIGKTSVARRVAHDLRGRYRDGAWLVELASLSDPALVVPTVARTLHLALTSQRDDPQALVDALRGQTRLLVLDNCEQVRSTIADLAQRLMAQAPGITVFATSQEPLKLTEERLYRLPPLSVPDPRARSGTRPDVATAATHGAVQLLVERIRAVDAGFELTEANLASAIGLCRQLDGIPLAIELASARVPLLGLDGVLARLTDRLRLLSGGARSSLRRHQTLRAALEWSHHLLAPDEQKVFRRLGVFAGGFDVTSAQRVVTDATLDAWAALDALSGLVDRSLVAPDAARPGRHRLLESTRAFALEKLAEAGETALVQRRHAGQTRGDLVEAIRRRDMDRLRTDMSNIRAAFAWAAGEDGDREIAVTLATGSAVVLAVEGFVVEALQRLLRVEPWVDASIPPPVAARYWQWLGRLGVDGRLPISRCLDALGRAERMFAEQGNLRHHHACLRMQAEALLSVDALDAAGRALAEAQRLEVDDANPVDRLRRLRVTSLLHDRLGRPDDALELAGQALRIATAGDVQRYVLILQSDLAHLLLRLGQAQAAETQFDELVARARDRPSDGLTLAQALAGLLCARLMLGATAGALDTASEAVAHLQRAGLLAGRCDLFARLAASVGHTATAARLIGASDAFHRRSETAPDPIQALNRAAAMAHLEREAATIDVRQWRHEGEAMSEIEVATLVNAALRP